MVGIVPHERNRRRGDARRAGESVQHRRIPVAQRLEAEGRIVAQGPLAPRMAVAEAIPFAREIDPFRMAELVAHEVEVGAAVQRKRGEPRHLVERHAARDGQILLILAHPVIDFLIHQLEEERLAAHERLIVRLHIRNDLLLLAPVGEDVIEPLHRPILVRHLLRQMEPVVRLAHRHPVVEPDPSRLDGRGAARHARNILRDRDRPRIHRMDHLVGERQVRKGVAVHGAVEVHRIVGERRAESMMGVEHRGDAVEAEPVEVVFIEPETAVGEKEMKHLHLPVVEAA